MTEVAGCYDQRAGVVSAVLRSRVSALLPKLMAVCNGSRVSFTFCSTDFFFFRMP